MSVQICVPITGRTLRECLHMLERANEFEVDVVEFRMDYLREKTRAIEVIKASELPLIATLRPVWEGGKFKGSEKEREKLLVKAADSADYVDVELGSEMIGNVKKAVRGAGAKLIVSKHDFKKTPPQKQLEEIIEQERKNGADVCKLVSTATKFEDNTRMLELVSNASKKAGVVAFCMGELGITSRILSPLFGASFTFACLEYGKETAAGQVSVEDLHEIYKVILRSRQKPEHVA